MSELLQTYLKVEKPAKVQVSGGWTAIEKFNFIGLPANEINEDEGEKTQKLEIDLSLVGKAKPVKLPGCPAVKKSVDELYIKPQILKKVPITNQVRDCTDSSCILISQRDFSCALYMCILLKQAVIDKESCRNCLTPLQMEIMSAISNYYDFYYPLRTLDNEDAIRMVGLL